MSPPNSLASPPKTAADMVGNVPGFFVSFAWKPADDFDINPNGELKVGQLDVGDLLLSLDVQNNSPTAGNANLMPEQAWILSSEFNRKLGPWGALKLAAECAWIEDVVDRVLIDAPGQPTGRASATSTRRGLPRSPHSVG